jgi:hypothetical protein
MCLKVWQSTQQYYVFKNKEDTIVSTFVRQMMTQYKGRNM